MEESPKKRALALWEEAQRHHLDGEIGRAIELYSASIDLCPTAEAHTFRGWAYSLQGRIDEAIAECREAIAVDPSFGNPYNDIGSYLMRLGRLDEAVPWLEKAKRADRYEPRHFPFLNLARLYAHQGQLSRAIEELHGALDLHPGDMEALIMLRELTRQLN
jgi:tetratricopeptide (TPR) repeat protein